MNNNHIKQLSRFVGLAVFCTTAFESCGIVPAFIWKKKDAEIVAVADSTKEEKDVACSKSVKTHGLTRACSISSAKKTITILKFPRQL